MPASETPRFCHVFSNDAVGDNETAASLPVNIITDGVVTRSVRDTANFLDQAEAFYRNPELPAGGRGAGSRFSGTGKGDLRPPGDAP